MGTRIAAILMVVVGSLGALGFFAASTSPDANGAERFLGCFFILVALGGAYLWFEENKFDRAQRIRAKKNFAWYKEQHPECCRGRHVSCHSCGGTRTFVRHLMNETYFRAHICTQCGTTLYYSPENA